MKIKIYLDQSVGNSVKKMDQIQNLFGGAIVRKPNFFGYFFRTTLESMSDSGEVFDDSRIAVESNRYNSKEDFESDLNLKLKVLDY
jgi:hypothetical protein